jgi:hypothetical protein
MSSTELKRASATLRAASFFFAAGPDRPPNKQRGSQTSSAHTGRTAA